MYQSQIGLKMKIRQSGSVLEHIVYPSGVASLTVRYHQTLYCLEHQGFLIGSSFFTCFDEYIFTICTYFSAIKVLWK